MTATIDYDLPVRNFIDALSATGHVSHVQHRKTHVTLHHNGGRLSHEGVLSVWQQRPASAHFNSDAAGTIAQYVVPNEYAWATGSTEGNQRSISIEMCNQTVGPSWIIGEATWRAAARLAGWIFARIIGYRPTSEFLVVHHDWSATLCAGPFIDGIYWQVLEVAQRAYDDEVNALAANDDVLGKWPGTEIDVTLGKASYETYLGAFKGGGDAGPLPGFKAANNAAEAAQDVRQAVAEAYVLSGGEDGGGKSIGRLVFEQGEAISRIEDRLDAISTGTGYSLKDIAKAVVAELKLEGN